MKGENRCTECGAAIPAESPGGLCGKCLFGLGLIPEQVKAGESASEPDISEEGKHDLDGGKKISVPVPDGHDADKSTVLGARLTERPGDWIGRYKLLELLGEGGFGTVYVAEQKEPVKRRVALKIIKLGMDTRQVVARFEAERQALALMDHPNIAKVFDAGATETGRPYFVMELVRGTKITEYCDANKLSPTERLHLFVQICQAVQHAHQKGVIHRDIKPSNILVTLIDGTPTPKVIDFGIAKATAGPLTDKTIFTAFEQFIGTPAYMSPEQAEMTALDIDTRSDIYSLGVLLYELLTSKTPFDAKELLAAGLEGIRRTIREKEPARPSTRLSTMMEGELVTTAKDRQTEPPRLIHLVRGDLDWIVMKCLEKDRTRRYETANGLAGDLVRHMNDEPVTARPQSQLYRFQKMVRRNKLGFTAAAAVVVVLVAGIVATSWQAGVALVEKRKTQSVAVELSKSLAASDFLQAVRLSAEDNGPDALAYLQRSLSLDPTNRSGLTRLVTLLTYHDWMAPSLLLKPGSGVNSAQFSPDGTRIVTALQDSTARVWDSQTGKPLTEPMTHKKGTGVGEEGVWRPTSGPGVHLIQFSPDGKRIVTACGDAVLVWDARTGQHMAGPISHTNRVYSAHFSSDGKQLLTSSFGFARIWDVENGTPLTEPMIHDGTVVCAQFSPDGKWIATACGDAARIWNAQTGQALTESIHHGPKPTLRGSPVVWVQFSPNGKRIVTAYGNAARIWDAQSGQPVTEPMQHGGAVASALFSPDGTHVLTASADYTARLWDAETGRPLLEPIRHAGFVVSAKFSSDGKRILTASADLTARVWDGGTGKPLTQPMKHAAPVTSAEFAPDGHRILTVSSDGTTEIWEKLSAPALEQPMRQPDSGGLVDFAQFSPDGKEIVTISYNYTGDKGAQVWDPQTGTQLTGLMKHAEKINSAQFSPDGKRIVTASDDKSARVWDAGSGQPLTGPIVPGGAVLFAQFSPDGKWIVTASENHPVSIWDSRTGQRTIEPISPDIPAVSVRFSPDGKRIVTTGFAISLCRVWDAQSGRPATEPMNHSGVLDAQFSADGKLIVTASAFGTAQVWDARTGQPIAKPMTHGARVNSARFSSDGKRVVTASRDYTARVWDAQSGQPVIEPMKHRGFVFSAQFSQDGNLILTASSDGTARVWDAFSGQPVSEPFTHPGEVFSAQFSPDGKRIVTTALGSNARVWDVAPNRITCPEWLLQLGEAISGEVVNSRGVLEETKLNRIETIQQIREMLSRGSDEDDWVLWGRWFLANPATRSVSPFSKMSLSDHNAAQGAAQVSAQPSATQKAGESHR